ncbi:progesterone receptor isoform X2 [Ambystoma mexicanum]|uniref:progesterone receptor isoform X2 n=1 Tax=Ambystoma mexicanum TaxID=8296 RepID=UPI0037E77F88
MDNQKIDQSLSPPSAPPSAEDTPFVPQDQLLQTQADSLDGLLYQGAQLQGQSYPKSDDASMDSDLEKALVESFMSSEPGQARCFDSWLPFDIAEVHSGSNVTSDTRPEGSQGVEMSSTFLPEKVTEDAEALSDPTTEKTKLTLNQDTGKIVTSNQKESPSPALTSHLLPFDFIRMPGFPLNLPYLATKARQLLQVDGYDMNAFSPHPSPQSSEDYVGFVQPPLGMNEDMDHALQPSSMIKEEDGTPYTNPSGSGHELGPQKQKPPVSLFKNEMPFRLGSYDASGGRPSSSLQHPSIVHPGGSLSSTSTTPQDRYQQFSFQTSGLRDLTPLYTPYASYTRSDAEGEHSSQYNFEVVPQKICLICGDEASGCHYGVLTCGSCKVFFKRAMEGQQNYLCAGRNDCIIDRIRRKNCPACRLRECRQAGMVLGGRKFKKFKTIRRMETIAYGQSLVTPVENQQPIIPWMSTSSTQELQFIPQLLNILQSIEPEVVYAGYDNTQSETPSALLTSLNRLCERQLLCVVKWSKSLPGFRSLHIEDQITLLQYSWMSLMVFAMGWRSYKHVSGQMLYFAPDLILNEQRMKDSSIYNLCLSMWQIPQEFVNLQVTQEEFLCMKALILLNTIPIEGLRSQNVFDDMRGNYIRELIKAIGLRQKGVVASSQRFYQLTKLMDSMHELVKKLHLFCLNTFLQSRTLSIEFPEMMSEVIAAQLPKILAGMVKPLLFNKNVQNHEASKR